MDPKRLLDLESDAGALERDLLMSLKPPADARRAVWHRLVKPGVLVLAASATASTVAAKSTAVASSAVSTSSALAAKVGLVLLVAAPIVGGGVYLSQRASLQPPLDHAASSVRVKALAPAASAPEAAPSGTPELEPPAPVAEAAAAKAERSATPEAIALREENALLREARTAARGGDPARALATLKTLDRRFPAGALLQERELLRIQALRAQGSHAAAEARARRFLKSYPSSPYASHVRASLGTQGQ